jgi:hypothetical protein
MLQTETLVTRFESLVVQFELYVLRLRSLVRQL